MAELEKIAVETESRIAKAVSSFLALKKGVGPYSTQFGKSCHRNKTRLKVLVVISPQKYILLVIGGGGVDRSWTYSAEPILFKF